MSARICDGPGCERPLDGLKLSARYCSSACRHERRKLRAIEARVQARETPEHAPPEDVSPIAPGRFSDVGPSLVYELARLRRKGGPYVLFDYAWRAAVRTVLSDETLEARVWWIDFLDDTEAVWRSAYDRTPSALERLDRNLLADALAESPGDVLVA